MVSLPACRRLAQAGLVLLAGLARGDVDDYVATTSSQGNSPQSDDTLVLTLSVTPGEFSVVPLTDTFGVNESGGSRRTVNIVGNVKTADDSNYNEITGRSDVAYLSCDEPKDDTNIDPDKILNELMQAAPEAIILYSTSGNWCSLDYTDPISFTNVLSMVDAGEAVQVLDFLNGTNSGDIVQVSITGNTTQTSHKSGGGSTAAMSVLYSITGIISLLFIIIITTGAIRAHRYPERYGPRGAFGGRPRQSRAKGLARAVLETLPIVKFGNQQPRKPDPELELETATQRTASITSENQAQDVAAAAGKGSQATPAPDGDSQAAEKAAEPSPEHLGCSICTEDFEVGEDVRVLPCSHQFHPTCIDPWLVNVSGTCPLCRLNLQPGHESKNGEPADGDLLPPPLRLEGDEETAASYRQRLSRIFDIHRLRQATAEEQMDALRQMRAQEAEPASAVPDREERHHGANFTAKLKEKFRIRTRAQPES